MLLPSFVAFGAMLVAAWWVRTGPAWRHWLGLGVLGGLTLWSAASWFGRVDPPVGLEVLALVGLAVTGMQTQSRLPRGVARRVGLRRASGAGSSR